MLLFKEGHASRCDDEEAQKRGGSLSCEGPLKGAKRGFFKKERCPFTVTF